VIGGVAIVVAWVAAGLALLLVGGVAWALFQDSKAEGVSPQWRDQHYRHDGRHDG
jgi:predicted ribosomally synthesized peptide with SipW-like signal peptide